MHHVLLLSISSDQGTRSQKILKPLFFSKLFGKKCKLQIKLHHNIFTISTWIETPLYSANHYLQTLSFWFESELHFCIKVMNDSENCLLFAAPSFPSSYHTLQENNAFIIQCSECQIQNTQYKDKVKILKLVVFIINFCSQLLFEKSLQENQLKSCLCLWSSYYNNPHIITKLLWCSLNICGNPTWKGKENDHLIIQWKFLWWSLLFAKTFFFFLNKSVF